MRWEIWLNGSLGNSIAYSLKLVKLNADAMPSIG